MRTIKGSFAPTLVAEPDVGRREEVGDRLEIVGRNAQDGSPRCELAPQPKSVTRSFRCRLSAGGCDTLSAINIRGETEKSKPKRPRCRYSSVTEMGCRRGAILNSFIFYNFQANVKPRQRLNCAFLRHSLLVDFPQVSACFPMLPILGHTNSTPVDRRPKALPLGFFNSD
jgi:hypothetical protein